MRLVGYLMILEALLTVVGIHRDSRRGAALEPASPISISGYAREYVLKRERPGVFEGIMAYQWGCATFMMGGGILLLRMSRRANETDPLAPEFVGQSSLDELDQKMKQEEARMHRPLR